MTFQSSPSIQRETRYRYDNEHCGVYFNPLPLYRGRPAGYVEYDLHTADFNPLPLYRGRRRNAERKAGIEDFNPLPLYRGRRSVMHISPLVIVISILSLYTEGDLHGRAFPNAGEISILSLYTEGDSILVSDSPNASGFQSSPSIQRETYGIWQYGR